MINNSFSVRAEILYRCSVPPFDKARDVLSTLLPGNFEIKKEPMVQSSETLYMFDNQDILKLCNIIPNEVLGLPSGGKEVQHSNLLISIQLLMLSLII